MKHGAFDYTIPEEIDNKNTLAKGTLLTNTDAFNKEMNKHGSMNTIVKEGTIGAMSSMQGTDVFALCKLLLI